MENNTVEKKVNKKSGKLWILKSVILIATVLALAAILITIIIRYRSSSRLSQIERECYEDVTRLYNESISNSYESTDDTNPYEVIVSDTASHLRMIEIDLGTSNFKYKSSKSKNYDKSISLTFSGLASVKTKYNLEYNRNDNLFFGTIGTDDRNYATFIFNKNDKGYTTTLTGGNGDSVYSLEHIDKEYQFTKNNILTNVVEKYTLKDSILTFDDTNKYTFGLSGNSIQISKIVDQNVFIGSINLITKDKKNTYEYSFTSSDKKTVYDILR